MTLYTLALGFTLGFVGYLPPGNINLSVVEVAVTKTVRTLWAFILFIAMMEFIYCVGCLKALDLLANNPQWMIILEWMAAVLFLILGILSFVHHSTGEGRAVFSGIKRGIFVAIFNPLQAPFWLGWGVYLMEYKILDGNNLNLAAFAFITSVGTIVVLQLYAAGGKTLVNKLNLSSHTINRFIGGIFIILSLGQFLKLILVK